MSDEENNHVGWTGSLTRLSLNRRITVLVLFLTTLVVGIIATIGIPLELVPQGFEMQSLQVWVPWGNAPAQEVLDKITLPLEEELSTVKGLGGMNSWSSRGGSSVFLRFKQRTDMSVAYREVRDRVERARLRFPEDVDRVFVRKEDVSGIPVAVLGLAIDPALTDYYGLVEKEILLPLSRIDGVATVNTEGLREKEIIIEVNKKKADACGLNIYQMAQELGGDNFSLASGQVRDSGKKFLLRSLASFKDLDDLKNRPLTKDIRLKDVAEVKYEEPERNFSVRVNSRPAIAVVILKEGGANTVGVSRSIRETLEKMQQNPRLASIQMENLFNQGQVVEDSIGNLIDSGRIGGFFAALVLFLFLRRFRLTAIITLSIPLSMLIALVAMFFAGETLNVLTLLGLVICVGLLVDNSIVVAENIHRHTRDGISRREACIKGAGEIALAITLATLTTIIVFLPAALLEGEAQFFLLRLSLPISVALVASLLVALIFIPLSVYLTLPKRAATETPSLFRRIHDRVDAGLLTFYRWTFESLNHTYNNALAMFLKRRLDLMLLLGAVFAVTYFVAFKNVELSPQQEEDETGFDISVEISNEYNFDEIAQYFRSVEKIMEEKKDEYALKGYFIMHHRRWGRLQGWFDKDNRDRSPAKVVAEKILKILPEKPGFKPRYRRENQKKEDKGKEVFVVNLQGEDAYQLDQLAEALEPTLLKVPGVLGIRRGNERAPNELALVIDRDRANASQVNPQIIAGVVGYALRGSSLPKYNFDGREVPVRIRFREEDRNSLQALSDFRVPTGTGEPLAVAALTDTRSLRSARGISRRNKRVTRSITLDLKKDEAKEARQTLSALQKRLDLPEGVRFGADSGYAGDMEEFKGMAFALPLSVLFIYLLMGFLFESFILPLSIILTIPLSTLGVAWIHFLAGKDVDLLGAVGSILLIGVVVNNGIVLIDYVNRLRREGMDRSRALLQAADRRFRPIVMTALTTIIGMVPLTVSQPNELGLSYKSFGLTLIGGMTTASILTLLVVPIFYTFFDDARQVVGRTLKWVMAGSRRTEPPPDTASTAPAK